MIIRMACALPKFLFIGCFRLLYVLKWLHTFVPDCEHLDHRTFLYNIADYVKRDNLKPPSNKMPSAVSAEMVNGILDKYSGPESCSKDLKIDA